MSDTMLAAIFQGPGDLELERRPVPQIIAADDVIIRVGAVGICGSDLHALHNPPEHPGHPGVIFGHEFCGEIVAVGPAVKNVAVGDSVAVDQNPPCGRCGPCKDGRPNFCEPLFDNPYLDYAWPNTPGFFWDGGMAEYVKVPAYFTYKVDPDVPKHLIVLAEPLGCALNAVNKVEPMLGEHAVVIGAGPIGLLCIMALRHAGVGTITVIEPSETRAAVALEVGADAVVNPITQDAAAAVRERTDGKGAAIIIEAVGSQLDAAIELAADEARIAVIGINSAYHASFSPITLTTKELRIVGVFLMRYTMQQALDLIQSNALPLERIVSHVLPLDQVQEGIDLARRGEGLKIVFTPNGSATTKGSN